MGASGSNSQRDDKKCTRRFYKIKQLLVQVKFYIYILHVQYVFSLYTSHVYFTAASSRVMLFLIGTTDIRLISLGSKETLLAKRLNEVCRIMKVI